MFDISSLVRAPAYDPQTGHMTKIWRNFYEGIYPSANWGYGNTKAEKRYFDGANVYTGTIVLADAAADFDLGTIVGDLDDIDDGTTYGKILSSSLSSGLALLSQAAGDLDDIGDGTGYGKVAKTDISAGHILLSACTGDLDDVAEGTNYGKVAITDISSGHILLSACTGDLDDVSEGTNYGKVAITDISSGHILLSTCDGNLDDVSDGSNYGKVASTSISSGKIIIQGTHSSLADTLNPGNNIPINPGFETAGTEDALAWTQGANISRETSGGNGSNCFLRVAYGTNVFERYPDDSANRYHEVGGGDIYEFGCDARSSNGTCVARIALYEYDKDQSYVTANTIDTTDMSWDYNSDTVALNASTKFVNIRVSGETSSGNADFDNVFLRKLDSLAVSWGHSSDITQIDGGTIYTDTIVANSINGAGFGTLTISSGKIQITTSDGFEVSGSGSLKVIGDDSTPGKIRVAGTSYACEIFTNKSGSSFYIQPDIDGAGNLYLGYQSYPIFDRWNNIFLNCDSNIYIRTKVDQTGVNGDQIIIMDSGTGITILSYADDFSSTFTSNSIALNPGGGNITLTTAFSGVTSRAVLAVDSGVPSLRPASAGEIQLGINGNGYNSLYFSEKSSDPSLSNEGNAVIWMSNGTGSGDDGDIMMTIRAGFATKTTTLVDFSAI